MTTKKELISRHETCQRLKRLICCIVVTFFNSISYLDDRYMSRFGDMPNIFAKKKKKNYCTISSIPYIQFIENFDC